MPHTRYGDLGNAVVPERKPAFVTGSPLSISFFTIYRDRRFWRIAPLGATGVGTSFSLQELWAAPWLTDTDGACGSLVLKRSAASTCPSPSSAELLRA
jgi:hypothetical protein